jgi:hypothetical protein
MGERQYHNVDESFNLQLSWRARADSAMVLLHGGLELTYCGRDQQVLVHLDSTLILHRSPKNPTQRKKQQFNDLKKLFMIRKLVPGQ